MVSIDAKPHLGRNVPRRGRLRISVKKGALCCICVMLLPFVFLLVFSDKDPTQNANNNNSWGDQEESNGLSQLRPQRLSSVEESGSTNADGHFNGFPVYLRQAEDITTAANNDDVKDLTTHSSVHCVGDNYQEDAWLQRSCAFSMLCYDLDRQDFVIFQSPKDQILEKFLQARPASKVASSMHKFTNTGSNSNGQSNSNGTTSESMGVGLGGLNLKWSLQTSGKPTSTGFKWFPRILNATDLAGKSYYALPSNTVMIPYHSLSAKNPGHLVWDDFLPIYNLLAMFQIQNRVILPLRLTFPGLKLFGSCEASDKNEHMCQHMTNKFLSLLVGEDYPYTLTRSDMVQFESSSSERSSDYVCAPRGAAGLATLTDHGTKKFHGWMRDDYKITQNHGRGALLYEFRNFMLDNIGLLSAADSKSASLGVPSTTNDLKPPYKIVFSVASSDIGSRNLDFIKQMDTLKQSFPPDLISVESYAMKDLTVKEQVKLASETSVFITICGGGAVTGMFLPKGAAVILYYLEHGGVEFGVMTGLPAHLDWDLFNNLAHLRTHWLPTQTMDQRIDLRALVLLVRQELELIQSGILI